MTPAAKRRRATVHSKTVARKTAMQAKLVPAKTSKATVLEVRAAIILEPGVMATP